MLYSAMNAGELSGEAEKCRQELEKLRDEDPDCEVVCHFCHTKYHFDLNQLVEKAAYKKEAAEEPAENA
mgnify:CR=1 FL=1